MHLILYLYSIHHYSESEMKEQLEPEEFAARTKIRALFKSGNEYVGYQTYTLFQLNCLSGRGRRRAGLLCIVPSQMAHLTPHYLVWQPLPSFRLLP